MSKPLHTAFAPPPVSATPDPAAPCRLALRWSADAALPTWQPGRLDMPSSVRVRFSPAKDAR